MFVATRWSCPCHGGRNWDVDGGSSYPIHYLVTPGMSGSARSYCHEGHKFVPDVVLRVGILPEFVTTTEQGPWWCKHECELEIFTVVSGVMENGRKQKG